MMISQHTISTMKGPPQPRAVYPEKREHSNRGQPECHLCQEPPILGVLADGKWRCSACTSLAIVTPPAKATASYYPTLPAPPVPQNDAMARAQIPFHIGGTVDATSTDNIGWITSRAEAPKMLRHGDVVRHKNGCRSILWDAPGSFADLQLKARPKFGHILGNGLSGFQGLAFSKSGEWDVVEVLGNVAEDAK